MKDETPSNPSRLGRRKKKEESKRKSRKLNLGSRIRGRFRTYANRVLGADVAWSGMLVLVLLAMLGSQRCAGPLTDLEVGDMAPRDLRAQFDIEVIDEGATEALRRIARDETPEIYTYDTERRGRLASEVAGLFREGRMLLAAHDGQPPEGLLRNRLGRRMPESAIEVLARQRFSEALEQELTGALSRVMDGPIVGNKPTLERLPAITMVQVPGRRERRLERYDEVLDLRLARERLTREIRSRLTLPDTDEGVIAALTQRFLDANLFPDSEESYQRKEAAAALVPPVRVEVERGELLIRQGDRITEENLARLRAGRLKGGSMGVREALGLLLILGLLAFFLQRYATYHQRRFRKIEHLQSLLVLMMLSMLLLGEGLVWVAREAVERLPAPFSDLSCYVYLIPLGAGAILVTLLANGRIALVYSAFTAILFGALHGTDFYLTLWAFIVQCCGIYAISAYRERAALIRAGLIVGAAGAITTVAIEIVRGQLIPMSSIFYGAGLAFVGGAVGAGLLVSFTLPLLERLFNVLTDVRLLELSNLNSPLLSELAVKAPGSYNHSLVVGTLAEEGAKAIGANTLFCRVAALYHDIGKMNHAEYFVENQRGVNPHDRLTPSMSALIIASHVKDGIKLAREAGIPEQIIDIIPQHHGTKKMSYFYEKARSATDPSMSPVKEEDFRYPGPKPQTREAAIFMLADGIEAAARTVEEPTANRLRELIRKLTNSIVLDGQLDSCDLTFSDLDRIQQAFLRLLVSMYHHRVDYPGFDFGKRKPAKGTTEPAEKKVARNP